MDTTQSQWPQGIGVVEGGGARKARPEKDEILKCPRCNSTNTKFCYYNNYSLSQPRYFCKTCRRYWTAGGSLRNVPVGGGSRKNKRSSSSPLPSPPNSSKIKHDHVPPTFPPHDLDQNPSKIQFQGQDLNLAYPPQYYHDQNPNNTTSANTTTPTSSFKTGIADSRGLMSSFVSVPGSDSSTMYPNGYNPFKPSGALNFSLDDGLESTSGARLLFPFEDSNTRGQGESTALGYWSGMLGGGGSW